MFSETSIDKNVAGYIPGIEYGGSFGGSTAEGSSGLSVDLPSVVGNRVEQPNSAFTYDRDDDPYTSYSNSSYFDDYLNMLRKGSDIGIFATAQNVADEAQKDRLFQSLEAEKERQWYEDLSNSAYQRQVKDLEAAGLNPILGFANLGSGAQSAHSQVPQGSSTRMSAQAPSLSDYINAGANVVSSAAKVVQSVGSVIGGIAKVAAL